MANKDKNKSSWQERFENFADKPKETVKETVADKQAAANIVSRGIALNNIQILKKTQWLLVIDVWLIFALCCLTPQVKSYEVSRELVSIDIIATCWALFEICRNALNIYRDNAAVIPAAVRSFGSKAFGENCLKAGYTKELIYLPGKDQQDAKIEELKKGLSTKIFRKTIVILVILLTGSFCLWGFIRFWEVPKALLLGLLGIPAGLLVGVLLTYAQGRS